MANQRPINRRPWRKKPWAKRRPTRWNAVTNGANEDAIVLNTVMLPSLLADGNAPLSILVDGQVDVEPWADDQEVTIDRIVGAIHVYGRWVYPLPNSTIPPMPLVKLGIVLNEELSKDTLTAVPTRNLFDQEDLEDTEWMWLYSSLPPASLAWPPIQVSDNGVATCHWSVPVDIRNRRKIGQSDQLALYGSWCATTTDYQISLQTYTDVRVILMSR